MIPTTVPKLMLAEQQAKALFDAVEKLGLIAAGKFESELTNEIALMAHSRFGVEKHWHKKIVRSGPNTLHPYNGDPADRLIKKDDILFLDLGPVFDGFEADLGRTYVLSDDPLKLKLKSDVETAWQQANTWISNQTRLTGADCFHYVTALAETYGWEFGGEIAGHIVGRFLMSNWHAAIGVWIYILRTTKIYGRPQKTACGDPGSWRCILWTGSGKLERFMSS